MWEMNGVDDLENDDEVELIFHVEVPVVGTI